MKPTDDYVRGYKDAKIIIDEVLVDVIEVLKEALYCERCHKHPQTHSVSLGVDPMNYNAIEEFVEVCSKCNNNYGGR